MFQKKAKLQEPRAKNQELDLMQFGSCNLVFVIWFLLLGSWLFLDVSNANGNPDDQKIRDLLNLSKDIEICEEAAGLAVNLINNIPPEIDKANKIKLRNNLKAIYTAGFFLDNVIEVFEKNPNSDYFGKVEKWYNSGLAKKILEADSVIDTKAGQMAFENFVKTIDNQNISKKKEKLINDIMLKTGVLEFTLNLMILRMGSYLIFSNEFIETDKKLTQEKVHSQVMGYYNQIKRDTQIRVFTELIFSYKNLTEEELKKYYGFLISDEGKWYTENLRNGIFKGFDEGKQKVLKTLK